MKIIGASLKDCVHIQGIYNFLRLAEEHHHQTLFLGPAMSIDQLIQIIDEEKPNAVAVSYRLTPENGKRKIEELITKTNQIKTTSLDFLFGGTPPLAEIARQFNFFTLISDGNNQEEVISYLNRKSEENKSKKPPYNLLKRISWKKPYPLIRTHFGLPTLEKTINGIEQIAKSKLIDVISLGTDQDTQANFYHPERQSFQSKGAGGVPVRCIDDFQKLFSATKRGNFPLMRTYAGTDNLIKLAEMYEKAFGNVWSAVPIFWFNLLDGRGPHDLKKSISEHLKLISWNAQNDIPVEILESHHWGMRWAHDTIQVATAYLGAKICKKLKVKNYIQQYMFNVPPETSFINDLSKMQAIKEMLKNLESQHFKIYHQTRTGLASFPNDFEEAKGQLASSTMLQMQMSPDIIHVVNYTESNHAATATEVIDSAKIVNQVIKNSLGSPSMIYNQKVQKRKNQLIKEADFLINYIEKNGNIIDYNYLYSLVSSGLFDAPMLKNNYFAKGKINTKFIDGECHAIDANNDPINEFQRLSGLKINSN